MFQYFNQTKLYSHLSLVSFMFQFSTELYSRVYDFPRKTALQIMQITAVCGRQHDRKCRRKSSQYTLIIPHRVIQLSTISFWVTQNTDNRTGADIRTKRVSNVSLHFPQEYNLQSSLSPLLTGRMFVRRTYFGHFDEL